MTTSYAPIRDIPLLITSPTSHSERRITPTWSISTLKQKLEPITGIPPSSQRLTLSQPGQNEEVALQADDEDTVQVGRWLLQPGGEIKVTSTTPLPAHLTQPPLSASDPPAENPLPKTTYATLPNTVLSYKRAHQIGRFDPSLPVRNAEKLAHSQQLIQERGIEVGKRCALGADGGKAERRGVVRYVGRVDELPGVEGAAWVGVEVDEPTGRGDGSLAVPKGQQSGTGEEEESGGEGHEGTVGGRKRYFTCAERHAVFVRPERVVVGEFPVLDIEEELLDSDMEEL